MDLKILIISDAWTPQINGVVRTLEATIKGLAEMGHDARVIGPASQGLLSFRMPFYSEIRLEFFAHRRLTRALKDYAPDFIHIATEGPLGWAARSVCLREGRPFTTSYHTRFPEYLAARAPQWLGPLIAYTAYAVLRRFHAPAGAVMTATPSIEAELRRHKFRHLVRWSRGVDLDLFQPTPMPASVYETLQHPILLYVGRVAIEKNLRVFLDLKIKGSLVVIGDGPDLAELRTDYPYVNFLGVMKGKELALHYAGADLFVFPSTTDTFGLVLLEACAAGLRIAACPAPGPSDIFSSDEARSFAVLDHDLQKAVERALALPCLPALPRAFASTFSWAACTTQFFTHLQAPSPKATRRLKRWRRKIGEGI